MADKARPRAIGASLALEQVGGLAVGVSGAYAWPASRRAVGRAELEEEGRTWWGPGRTLRAPPGAGSGAERGRFLLEISTLCWPLARSLARLLLLALCHLAHRLISHLRLRQ